MRQPQLLVPQLLHTHPHERAETPNRWVPVPPCRAESIAACSLLAAPPVPRDGTPAARLTKQNRTRRKEGRGGTLGVKAAAVNGEEHWSQMRMS